MTDGRTPEQERLIRHLYYLDIARKNINPEVCDLLNRHGYILDDALADLHDYLQAELDDLR